MEFSIFVLACLFVIQIWFGKKNTYPCLVKPDMDFFFVEKKTVRLRKPPAGYGY